MQARCNRGQGEDQQQLRKNAVDEVVPHIGREGTPEYRLTMISKDPFERNEYAREQHQPNREPGQLTQE